MIGKIERLTSLRDVWKHEALNFTTWMVDNIDVLSEAIGLDLQDAQREQAVGDFSADLVAQDENGHTVVIENQLEKSDHNHLGKLMTYLAALDAGVGVWIVSEPRPEHTNAINWLNKSRLANFYLVKAEAIRIGSSEPACLFTLITGPSEETAKAGDTKEDIADRFAVRRRFWTSLLGRARPRTRLYSTVSPTKDNWLSVASGVPGLSFNITIKEHAATAQLVIDRGKNSDAENRAILEQIKARRAEVERSLGRPLIWYAPEGVRLCRIIDEINIGGYRDEEARWPEIQDAIVDAMVQLERTLKPLLQQIQ